MPEQTDKRRSWWGILAPTDRSDNPARASQPDLHAYKNMDTDYRSDHDDTASESGAHTNGGGKEGSALRRVSSKMDLFKKSTLPKRIKSRGGSKFATITTAFSSSKTTLPSREVFGSASSTTTDLNQYEKSGYDNSSIYTQQPPPQQPNDMMVFVVTEQPEYTDGERERDVVSKK